MPSKAAILRAQLEGAPLPEGASPVVLRPAPEPEAEEAAVEVGQPTPPKFGEEAYRVVYEDREVTVPGLRPFDFVKVERYVREAEHEVAGIEESLYRFWIALGRHRLVEERPGAFEDWAESVVNFYDFRQPDADGVDDRPLA